MALLITGIVSFAFTIPLVLSGIPWRVPWRDLAYGFSFSRLFGPIQIVIAVIQAIVAITNIAFSCPIVCCRQMIRLDSNGQSNLKDSENCEDDLPSYDQTCGNDQKIVELDFDGKTGLIVDSETNKTCIV